MEKNDLLSLSAMVARRRHKQTEHNTQTTGTSNAHLSCQTNQKHCRSRISAAHILISKGLFHCVLPNAAGVEDNAMRMFFS
jgi:hypothetical protein